MNALKAIAKYVYPEYRGRKLRIERADTYRMQNYWDGGSRSYVKALDLATGRVSEAAPSSGNPFNDIAHAVVAIPPGIALVEHSIFCGKDIGITVYVSNPGAIDGPGIVQLLKAAH